MCWGTGVLTALVLRAEWGLAQKAAKARAEVLPSGKEPLVESVDDGEDIPILTIPALRRTLPSKSECRLLILSTSTKLPDAPPSPLPYTTSSWVQPSSVTSPPSFSPSPPSERRLQRYTRAFVPRASPPWSNVDAFRQPHHVLGLVLWIRKDKDGREIWNYGERWTKEEPKDDQRVLSEAEVKRVVDELVPRANGDEKALSESGVDALVFHAS